MAVPVTLASVSLLMLLSNWALVMGGSVLAFQDEWLPPAVGGVVQALSARTPAAATASH
ncbi:MAG: hypothetical protein LCH89_13865 [Proteobacteria bacterium]|nr:hypothetical protein [Pseudomonadota bacterium]